MKEMTSRLNRLIKLYSQVSIHTVRYVDMINFQCIITMSTTVRRKPSGSLPVQISKLEGNILPSTRTGPPEIPVGIRATHNWIALKLTVHPGSVPLIPGFESQYNIA